MGVHQQVQTGLQERCMTHIRLKGPALLPARMQKSICCAFMHPRENQLRHADNDCKNSSIIRGTPLIKGRLLFKAAAGSADNQQQLSL